MSTIHPRGTRLDLQRSATIRTGNAHPWYNPLAVALPRGAGQQYVDAPDPTHHPISAYPSEYHPPTYGPTQQISNWLRSIWYQRV